MFCKRKREKTHILTPSNQTRLSRGKMSTPCWIYPSRPWQLGCPTSHSKLRFRFQRPDLTRWSNEMGEKQHTTFACAAIFYVCVLPCPGYDKPLAGMASRGIPFLYRTWHTVAPYGRITAFPTMRPTDPSHQTRHHQPICYGLGCYPMGWLVRTLKSN